MHNFIIGTAGHVDHGKTTLINALTGIDTDRLQEEKKRGITIELGFAYMDLPDGGRIGIVDVPGHEKFIKNMLAGAGGVDIALLVVAADEGFMPQTIEHLDILKLLNIQHGIIAITKCDMVDDEWLEEVYADIKDHVKGSFLENAEIIKTSAISGIGIDELRNKLIEIADSLPEKPISKQFRLPVDRIFSMQGFGTIITGTLIEGSLSVDDAVEIFPGKKPARVRSIQVHGESKDRAYAGQRVAVNIVGLKKEEIERGFVLASPGSLNDSMMIDVKIRLIDNSTRSIKNNGVVHFHHESNVTLAKVVLLGVDELNPGESDFAQLRFNDPVAVKAGDNFVLRFYSPLETIGGGTVINPLAKKLKRKNEDVIHSLQVKSSGSLDVQILSIINQNIKSLIDLQTIEKSLSIQKNDIMTIVKAMLDDGRLYDCGNDVFVSNEVLSYYKDRLNDLLENYHKQNPILPGIMKHDARLQLLGKIKNSVSTILFDLLLNDERFETSQDVIKLKNFLPKLSNEEQNAKEHILDIYKKSGIEAPLASELIKNAKNKSVYQRIISALVFENMLIPISNDYLLHCDVYNEILSKAKSKWSKTDKFTLAEFRDLLNTSRKYALLLFDYWDSKKITKKIDDYRIWL